jgi:hypothetical protein
MLQYNFILQVSPYVLTRLKRLEKPIVQGNCFEDVKNCTISCDQDKTMFNIFNQNLKNCKEKLSHEKLEIKKLNKETKSC